MSAFINGTLVSDDGIIQTVPLTNEQTVPGTAVFINGIAHTQAGLRYVCGWPTLGNVVIVNGYGVRTDGAQVIATGITSAAYVKGIGVSARGEALVATSGTRVTLDGFGVTYGGALLVSDAGFSTLGPTLDLVFAGQPTDGFVGSLDSIDLNFIAGTYQVGAQYMVWEQ